jgi:hypothetical protein
MDYKEPKKRVTKNDKKNKKEVYSQKHIRILLKQKESIKNKHGAIHTADQSLLADGRLPVHGGGNFRVHR